MANENMKIQSTRTLGPEKKNYQQKIQEYKFFNTDKCSDGFTSTGAFISSPSISCNSEDIRETQRCKAIARIEKGKLIKIDIIDCRTGYKNPIIEIIANNDIGNGAQPKVTSICENGSISFLEILDEGKGYNVEPTIVIKNVENNNRCYLCKKISV